jgi:hypothetical protein
MSETSIYYQLFCFLKGRYWIPKMAYFKKLLLEIESFLEVVEDVVVAPGTPSVDDHPFSWAPFLLVLKGFHAIATLYGDLME